MSRSVFFRIRYVSDKLVEKTKIKLYVQYFFSKHCADYEIMWKNMVEPDTVKMTI